MLTQASQVGVAEQAGPGFSAEQVMSNLGGVASWEVAWTAWNGARADEGEILFTSTLATSWELGTGPVREGALQARDDYAIDTCREGLVLVVPVRLSVAGPVDDAEVSASWDLWIDAYDLAPDDLVLTAPTPDSLDGPWAAEEAGFSGIAGTAHIGTFYVETADGDALLAEGTYEDAP